MISWSELEHTMRERRVATLNIQQRDGGFIVHHRVDGAGFVCAQKVHNTIQDAIAEHFGVVEELLV